MKLDSQPREFVTMPIHADNYEYFISLHKPSGCFSRFNACPMLHADWLILLTGATSSQGLTGSQWLDPIRTLHNDGCRIQPPETSLRTRCTSQWIWGTSLPTPTPRCRGETGSSKGSAGYRQLRPLDSCQEAQLQRLRPGCRSVEDQRNMSSLTCQSRHVATNGAPGIATFGARTLRSGLLALLLITRSY